MKKLQNKKTGEIGYLVLNINPNRESYSVLSTENGDTICGNLVLADYDTLSKLNEEWKDYEEPKEYWFVNDLDGQPIKCDLKNCGKPNFIEWREYRKQIGNYFETEEEAEKAVEKLKAWKRLRNKGFKFNGTTTSWYENPCIEYETNDYHNITDPEYKELQADLDLLFGGDN